jgi:septal ring-binding cell division protein DamX|tara:strand:- start:987 stop:1727 length:741 start_codon:yes stop_codon:yes gene_type:complete
MSHVWGQTVPSNYGRLPATRQKVFHATEDVAKQVIKETIQQVQEKVAKEVTQELQGKISKEITEDVIAEAQEKTLREIGEDTSSEAIEALYKKNLKELATEVTEEVAEQTTREVTQKTVKETVEAVPESVAERLGKRAITVGGIGVTGFAMFNSFLNSDAVDDYVASTTGRDCDEKAVEAGYEPGTQEYTDNVSACQEKAVENMAFLGKAMTYGGLGLATLVVVSVLGKMGIFSGSGSKEESDDEE